MKFDKLQFNFFNTKIVTDKVPFFHTCSVKYKTGIVDEYLQNVFKEIEILEISNEKINVQDMDLIIDSKYSNNSLTITLKVNDFKSFISVNLNKSGVSGTIMIDECVGFHYGLIMSEDAVKVENEKLMSERKQRK